MSERYLMGALSFKLRVGPSHRHRGLTVHLLHAPGTFAAISDSAERFEYSKSPQFNRIVKSIKTGGNRWLARHRPGVQGKRRIALQEWLTPVNTPP
jgi:hypothetical protein